MGLQVLTQDRGSGSGVQEGSKGARPRELGLGSHGSSGRGGEAAFPAARQAKQPREGLERSRVVRCCSPGARFGRRKTGRRGTTVGAELR